MTFNEALKWRYSCKKMNGQIIPDHILQNILEATRLSASSFGLQPYKILVVENKDVKNNILPLAFNQNVVSTCSHLLIYCAYNEVTTSHISDYMQRISEARKIDRKNLNTFEENVNSFVLNRDEKHVNEWVKKQCYLALSNTLNAAAMNKIDATPMEGFLPEKVDELLNLKSQNIHSVLMCALGYRDITDGLAKLEKVRKSSETLFKYIK